MLSSLCPSKKLHYLPDINHLLDLGVDYSLFICKGYDTLYLKELSVPTHLRGQGLGSEFLTILKEYAELEGFSTIIIEVFPFDLPRVESFYVSNGFILGVDGNFYYYI